MKVALLSREYPPAVYGGAGVHVQHLARALAGLVDLQVHCFGGDRDPEPGIEIFAHRPCEELSGPALYVAALEAMSVDLAMVGGLDGSELVHSHTWYTNFAGYLAKILFEIPHVVTVHSLEPRRPWKADQLGIGYRLSSWCERIGLESADAVIAVSHAVAADILECYPQLAPERIAVIHNAVDPQEFRVDNDTDVLARYGIDPARPTVVCVGRISRQKGIGHLLDAAEDIDAAAQLVLRVGPADTPELAVEIASQIAALADRRDGVIWIEESLDRPGLVQLLSHATVACCPSVYEPFGLVNVEAMACEAAVVASAVGGIPEVVEHGVTGLLVPFDRFSPDDPEPLDPQQFAVDLAAAINELIAEPDRAREMGRAGRRRVVAEFSWGATAARTVELYQSLTSR